MKTKVILILFLLMGVISSSLYSSCFKEGFELATEWKQRGELSWDGPYSLPDTKPIPGWFLSDTKSSPNCCKASTYSTSTGCLCTTPEQLQFLNMRGGNRTHDEGV